MENKNEIYNGEITTTTGEKEKSYYNSELNANVTESGKFIFNSSTSYYNYMESLLF